MKTFAVFALTAVLSGMLAEEFNHPAAWRRGVFNENTLNVRKKEISLRQEKVQPEKVCRLSFEYRRLPGGKPGAVWAVFRLFDRQKREIRPYHVIVRNPAIAEVAETVPAGSRTIRLNGAGSWKKTSHCALAFHARPDLSDLPNFSTFESPVENFRKEGNSCVITFKKAFPAEIAAGTLVREHRYGGEFYPWEGKTSAQWQKAEVELCGLAREGRDRNIESWQPGTVFASPVFVCVQGGEIRNMTIQFLDKSKAAPKAVKAGKKRPVRAYEKAEKQFDPAVRIKAFYPNGTNGFFLPQEELSFTAALESGSPCEGEILLFDYQGKLLHSRRFSAAGKAVTVRFPAAGKNGYFPAVCKAWTGKKLCAENHAGAVVMPAILRRDPWFGLNHNGMHRQLRDGYIRLGIGTLGIGFVTYHIDEIGKGSMDAYLKNRAQIYDWIVKDPDFQCYGAVSTSFKGRSVPSNFAAPDPGTREVARCIAEDFFPVTEPILMRAREMSRRVAEAYKDKITHWHVGEEIDASFHTSPPRGGTSSGTLTACILMGKQIYRGLKAGNPGARVDVLGIAGGDWRAQPQFPLSKIILKDLGKCFDGVFIDAYSGNWNSVNSPATSPEEGNLLGYLSDSALLSASYGRPHSVLNAERGYASNYFEAPASANNRQLADYTARSLIIARSAPCSGYIIFKAMTPTYPLRVKQRPDLAGNGFWDCDLWRAVLDENGKTVPVPKPMALAVAVAARRLAFTRFSARITPGNGVWIAIFEQEKSGSVAAVWTTGKELDMVCSLPAGTVMTDFQGNEQKLPVENTLRVSSSPFYLRSSLPAAELQKSLARAKYPVEVPAAGEGRLTASDRMLIQIVNKSSEPLSGSLIMPDGKRSGVTLKPYALEHFVRPVPEKAGNAVLLLGSRRIPIALDRSHTVVPRLGEAPKFDGSGAWMKPLPEIELKVPDHVTPKTALQWELGYFRNDGTDIHVKLYPAWDRDYFYLGAEVRDRTHLQRYTDHSIWKNDALQFAISTRFDSVKTELQTHPERNRYGMNEFSFGAALSGKTTILYSWSKAFRGVVGFPAKVTRRGEITLYEIAVPWSRLGLVPESGQALRFSALVMNVDSPEQTSAPYHLDFGGGIAGKEDVSLFRTLILGR